MGIVEFGRLMIIYTGAITASREAARYISIRDAAQKGAAYASIAPSDVTGIRSRVRDTFSEPIGLSSFIDDQIDIAALSSGSGVSIMTYNVLGSNRPNDNISTVIEADDPDIVGLHELSPSMTEFLEDRYMDIPSQALHRKTPMETASSSPELDPSGWRSLPIVPTLSSQAVDIYQKGMALGNNPQAFSKVGSGQIAIPWFLSLFDQDSSRYDLGPYEDLEPVIEYYAGSFKRVGIAARSIFNTTRILNPLFAADDICEVEETSLECELRRHRPSFAFISLGTNQVWMPDVFETELRQIVEICIEHGVVPILATKGDNLEGDHRINAIIAEVAREYEIPLWNFWLALQSLPHQGLQTDGEHLTWAGNNFDGSETISLAWPMRNLTALQVLQSLMTQLKEY
jgi:hypothetical protein